MSIFKDQTPKFARNTNRGFVLGYSDQNGNSQERISVDGSTWADYNTISLGMDEVDDILQLEDYIVLYKNGKVVYATNDWVNHKSFRLEVTNSKTKLIKGSASNEFLINTGTAIVNVTISGSGNAINAVVTARTPYSNFRTYMKHYRNNSPNMLAYDTCSVWENQNEVWTQILSIEGEVQWVTTFNGKIYMYYFPLGGGPVGTLLAFTSINDMVNVNASTSYTNLVPVYNDDTTRLIMWSYSDEKFVTLDPINSLTASTPTGLGSLGIQSMAYSVNAGRYVVSRNRELYSAATLDGAWTKVNHIGSAGEVTTIAGRFSCPVTTGNSLTMLYSNDAVDWQIATVDGGTPSSSFTTNYKYVVSLDGITYVHKTDSQRMILSSTDGMTWATKTASFTPSPGWEYGQPSVYTNYLVQTGNRLTAVLSTSDNLSSIRFTSDANTWNGTTMEDFYATRPIVRISSDQESTQYAMYEFTQDFVRSTNGGRNWIRFTPNFRLATNNIMEGSFFKYDRHTYAYNIDTDDNSVVLQKTEDLELWWTVSVMPKNQEGSVVYAGVNYNGKDLVAVSSTDQDNLVLISPGASGEYWVKTIFESVDDTETWERLPPDVNIYNLAPTFNRIESTVINRDFNNRYYRYSSLDFTLWDMVEFPRDLGEILFSSYTGMIGMNIGGNAMYSTDSLNWWNTDIDVTSSDDAYYMHVTQSRDFGVFSKTFDDVTQELEIAYTLYSPDSTFISKTVIGRVADIDPIAMVDYDLETGNMVFVAGNKAIVYANGAWNIIEYSQNSYSGYCEVSFGGGRFLINHGTMELFVSSPDLSSFTKIDISQASDFNIDSVTWADVAERFVVAVTEHDDNTDTPLLYESVDGVTFTPNTNGPAFDGSNAPPYNLSQILINGRHTFGLAYYKFNDKSLKLYTTEDLVSFTPIQYSDGKGGMLFGQTPSEIPSVINVLTDEANESTLFVTSTSRIEQ